MTAFQREIQTPLEALSVKFQHAAGGPNELPQILAQAKELLTRVKVFQVRASSPNSAYGENMKQKVNEAASRIETILHEIENAIGQQEDLVVHDDYQNCLLETTAPSATTTPPVTTVVDDADIVSTSNLEKIMEASRKIQEKEKRMKAEDSARHRVNATTEKNLREEMRQKERMRMEEARESEAKRLREFIHLGTVNHVHGREDLENKIKAAGKRARVLDWFAPWCGP